MAASLESQRAAIEKELETVKYGALRDVLEAQLAAISRKLTTKSNKTTLLADGTSVSSGSTVYQLTRAYSNYNSERGLPTITKHTVCAVSPDGSQLCMGGEYRGKHSYNSKDYFHGSPESAHKGAIAQVEKERAGEERDLESAQRDLNTAREYEQRVKSAPLDRLYKQ